ncbi:MAG: cytochrome b N-terminal domain-containing protein, partial [Actinomycetota bacterium]
VKVRGEEITFRHSWFLGVASLTLFGSLVVSGIYLMFFYRPSVEAVYGDMQRIHTQVSFGLLVRNLHRWGAHLMTISVFLHMARVFYTGAYKPPREFNWVVGVILLLLTLLLAFTGYLLPWDQLAVWAVTVGTEMMKNSPVIGDQVQFALLGGPVIGPETLLRWYTLHVLLLPFVIVIFISIHFWRVRKDGGISGPM